MLLSHARRFALGIVVAATLAPLAPMRAFAQARASCVEPDPSTRIARAGGLSIDDLDRLARGEIVVRQLAAPDRNEVALFGAVRVNAPRDAIVERVIERFADRPAGSRHAGARFGTPPSLDDVRDLTIDPGDLDALRACRPGDCNIKLPERAMASFESSIDWSAPHPDEAVAALVRARMIDYVARYRQVGDAALVRYDDQAVPADARAAAQRLLDETTVLRDEASALDEFVRRFPAETAPDIREHIEWSIDQPPGLRPITSITQIAAYAPGDAGPAFIVGKQLYASHYFDGLLDLRIVMSDPSSPARGTSLYLVVRRMRFDHLPSGGLLNTRGRVIGRLRGGLADELADLREWARALTRGRAF